MADKAGLPPSHDLETSATVQDVTADGVHTAEAQNAVAFIHTKLPPEIFFHLFRLYHPTSRPDIQVAHVCGYWRDMILGVPEFWVDMLAIEPPVLQKLDEANFYTTLVERSQPLPFTFNVGSRTDLLDTVQPQRFPRLRGLSMRTYGHGVMRLSLDVSMPTLEELELGCKHDPQYTREGFDLMSRGQMFRPTHFPRLRRLRIDGPFVHSIFHFPTVRELVINTEGRFIDYTFFRGLARYNDLEKLEIQATPPWEPAFDGYQQMLMPISFPHMVELRLAFTGEDTGGRRNILALFALPPTARLKVFGGPLTPRPIVPRSPVSASFG